jgi:hypothetical protein
MQIIFQLHGGAWITPSLSLRDISPKGGEYTQIFIDNVLQCSIISPFRGVPEEPALLCRGKGGIVFKVGDVLLSHDCSTIGAGGLNFSVRNGKRWNPAAIVT